MGLFPFVLNKLFSLKFKIPISSQITTSIAKIFKTKIILWLKYFNSYLNKENKKKVQAHYIKKLKILNIN